MKNFLLTSALALGLTSGLFALPISIESSDTGGAATGAVFVNFDTLALGNANQSVSGVNLSFTGNAKVVQGLVVNQYAPPFLSGDNGIGFGAPDQVNGADATRYLSAGTGSVSLAFESGQKYFGLLWGSVDTFNSLMFYDGMTLLGTFTGADVIALANGNQGLVGTTYVTFNSEVFFNKIVATSTTNSFEFDNIAFDTRKRVPDSASTVALLGLGLVGLAALRRKL